MDSNFEAPKKIYIVNGMARSGKDTFAAFLNEFIPTMKISSIDKIKDIAFICGWDRESKTEKDRKFLSDLKELTSAFSDLSFNDIYVKVHEFLYDNKHEILLIDIREPEEIERAKREFGAESIFIKNDRVEQITSNMADAGVYNYTYDHVIENNGTLKEFKENIREFYRINLEELK